MPLSIVSTVMFGYLTTFMKKTIVADLSRASSTYPQYMQGIFDNSCSDVKSLRLALLLQVWLPYFGTNDSLEDGPRQPQTTLCPTRQNIPIVRTKYCVSFLILLTTSNLFEATECASECYPIVRTAAFSIFLVGNPLLHKYM